MNVPCQVLEESEQSKSKQRAANGEAWTLPVVREAGAKLVSSMRSNRLSIGLEGPSSAFVGRLPRRDAAKHDGSCWLHQLSFGVSFRPMLVNAGAAGAPPVRSIRPFRRLRGCFPGAFLLGSPTGSSVNWPACGAGGC